MKNEIVYKTMFEYETNNTYMVTEEGFWNTILERFDNCKNGSKIYKNIKIDGKNYKCYLDKYIKYRLGYYKKEEGRSDKISFSGDFETITEYKYTKEEIESMNISKKEKEKLSKQKKARIWAYGLVNIYDTNKLTYGNNLTEFMEIVKSLRNADIYFHNLKFDGSFIVNWFHKNGVEYVSDMSELRENTYTTLVANGQYYTITWCVSKSNGNKRKLITFKDSFKIMPSSIKELGKSFAKELNDKGKVQVEKEFYKRYRALDHEITEEEKEYLHQDVKVMSEALKFMFELGHVKGTIGSNALEDFKSKFNEEDKNNYKNHFPKWFMGDKYDDTGGGGNSWVLRAYRGGFTYVSKSFRNKPIGNGIVLDVNSLYPFIMLEKLLPYGEGYWFNGDYNKVPSYQKRQYPLFIQKIKCEFVLKDDRIPTIPDKSNGRNLAEYLESSNGQPEELYLTNVDLELFLEHYDIIGEPEYIGGYMFRGKHGIFNKYVNHWKEVKINAGKNKALRYIAKLFLNSLYGKFASSWNKPDSYPDFEKGKGKLKWSKKNKFDDLSKEEQEEIYNNRVKYPAMAVFITAYARQLTIESAQKNYKTFRYADTDSLHLETLEFPTNINIDYDNTGKLGLWKHEGTFKRAKFIRSKTYIEDTFGKMKWDEKEGKEVFEECSPEESTCTKLKVTVSGMSQGCHKYVTFENFNEYDEDNPMFMPACDGKYWGNLRPENVEDGTDIVEGYYVIVKDKRDKLKLTY
jgi:hypothetical protein